MNTRRLFFILFILVLSACNQELVATDPSAPIDGKPEVTATATTVETPTPISSPSSPSEPTATVTVTAVPPATSIPPASDLAITADSLTLFPVPAIYAGDLVSFRVMPYLPAGLAPNEVDMQVLVDGTVISSGILDWRTFDGQPYGLSAWSWPATAGDHSVTVILDPADRIQVGDEDPVNNQVNLTVSIQPRAALPPAAANATWLTAENNCCTLHVVSGTAAHRDLGVLLAEVDGAFQQATSRLGEPINKRYDIYLVDRVFGQGGYASDDIVVSYLDRDYAGGGLREVLVHEAVHLLDLQFAPDRITFLAEGIAVWATGGHYQQENLGQRMAALHEIGRYVPLPDVLDGFYGVQHEISYLEAGSLVSYLVESYGWNRVRAFYSSVSADDGPSPSAAMDANLRIHFNQTLAEVETDWLAYLSSLPRDLTMAENLQTTIRFYEVMRRYQATYDPTAFYLEAWLPIAETAEQLGATADFSRHPESPPIIALETLLHSADTALHAGDYARTNALLDSVVRVLDNNGAFLDPLANAYLNIVRAASEKGYEAQQIEVVGTRATVTAVQTGRTALVQLDLRLNNQSWVLTR